MKVLVREEFDVFELFVYDSEALRSLCPHAVAEAINERLEDWEVRPPDGLDRCTLVSTICEKERYTDRYYTADQVRVAFPVDAVEQLEELNGMDFDLSPEADSGD